MCLALAAPTPFPPKSWFQSVFLCLPEKMALFNCLHIPFMLKCPKMLEICYLTLQLTSLQITSHIDQPTLTSKLDIDQPTLTSKLDIDELTLATMYID